MDAYIEKPMCLTDRRGPGDGQGRAKVQPRHPGRHAAASMPINNWASDLVKNGAIGKIAHRDRPKLRRPGTLDEDLVARRQGPVASLVGRVDEPGRACGRTIGAIHRGWGRWWDYDGGGDNFGVTGWGTHSYDQINRALGTDDTGPVEVTLGRAGGRSRGGQVRRRPDGRRGSLRATGDIDAGGGVVSGDTGRLGHRRSSAARGRR